MHEMIPLKRPHYELRGNKLYFLISKRPHLELAPKDLDIWNAIDGIATMADLQQQIPNARESAQRLWDSAVIEMAPSEFKPGRKPVLVFEPHMDDAALSVGGWMWKHRMQCEFTVVSIAGRSNFTSYYRMNRDYFDIETITAIRREESELLMRVLGGKHLVLDGYDAPLRYQPDDWSLDWYLKNRRGISAFVNHSPTDEEIQRCADSIARLLAKTEAREIWIPLGVGTSADHETTRDACLRALVQTATPSEAGNVFLYQDVPYAKKFPHHTGQILSALVSNGAAVERITGNVTDVMAEKLRLVSIFASQFKMHYMVPKVEATARMHGLSGGGFGELLVKLDKLPERIESFDLYSGRDAVRKIVGHLRRWLKRNRSSKRITILCPMGVGRWKEDVSSLLQEFPDTTFDFHLTGDAVDEAKRLTSPRIRIHPVNGLEWSWIRRILHVLCFWPAPLIVVTGNRFQRFTNFVRTVCIFSDPLPVTTIDHLVQALRIERTRPSAT